MQIAAASAINAVHLRTYPHHTVLWYRSSVWELYHICWRDGIFCTYTVASHFPIVWAVVEVCN